MDLERSDGMWLSRGDVWIEDRRSVWMKSRYVDEMWKYLANYTGDICMGWDVDIMCGMCE